ncbi:S8 family serine peptidase [Anoxynatronum buryatiense]|uniref:Serine protease, subtilisin family n=1 Tax=Anoxynatronum buryatiense TaxID=489973 RepID=A0AA46AJ65_9CLOT|nr:S8 family serine peptidase [Anoxynatronum buryatiense]SMP57016.1 Serine protease, subtilisin family [Anoxynatronum buryatiense]
MKMMLHRNKLIPALLSFLLLFNSFWVNTLPIAYALDTATTSTTLDEPLEPFEASAFATIDDFNQWMKTLLEKEESFPDLLLDLDFLLQKNQLQANEETHALATALRGLGAVVIWDGFIPDSEVEDDVEGTDPETPETGMLEELPMDMPDEQPETSAPEDVEEEMASGEDEPVSPEADEEKDGFEEVDGLPEEGVELKDLTDWVEIPVEPYGPAAQGLLRMQEARGPPSTDKSEWLLVTYDRPQGQMRLMSAQAIDKIERLQQISSHTDLVIPQSSEDRETLMDDLALNPNVIAVEENQPISLMAVNDPLYATQWYLPRVKASEAWTTIVTSGRTLSPVKVAVLDTGVQANHPDLTGRIAAGGFNYTNSTSNPADGHGHGTRVSGIIAASTNNSTGMAGVAYTWPVSILPLKVLDDAGNGSNVHMIAAIDYAVQQGAHVINLSLGRNTGGAIIAEETAINNAVAAGVTVIAAAGNFYSTSLVYPAAYANAINVGATSNDAANTRASFSNYNSTVDLVAPGVGMVTTDIGSTYTTTSTPTANGTSFSAPIVSGMAAVLKGLDPSVTPAGIKNILTTTATDLGPAGKDNEYGWGLVNFVASVDSLIENSSPTQVTSLSFSSDLPSPQSLGQTIALTAQSSGSSNPLYRFYVHNQDTGSWVLVQSYGSQNFYNWTPTVPGFYTLVVHAKDAFSSSSWDMQRGLSFEVSSAQKVTSLSFSSDLPSPQSLGQTIALTAQSSGSSNPLYRFYVHNQDTGSWVLVQSYGSQNFYNWTPTVPGFYTLVVHAKDAFSSSSWDMQRGLSFEVSSAQN